MHTIYLITCLANGKHYVGQTVSSVRKRFANHKYDAKRSPRGGKCVKLCNALRKYGSDNFTIESLTETDTQEKADDLEVYYIRHYDSIKTGYNIRAGGSRGRLSDTSKRKLSKALRNKRMGADNVRSKLTDESVRQIVSMSESGLPLRDIASQFSVSYNAVSNVLTGRTWTHVTGLKRVRGLSGRIMKGTKHPNTKLSDTVVRSIRKTYQTTLSYAKVAKLYGLGSSTVRDIIKWYTWSHVR